MTATVGYARVFVYVYVCRLVYAKKKIAVYSAETDQLNQFPEELTQRIPDRLTDFAMICNLLHYTAFIYFTNFMVWRVGRKQFKNPTISIIGRLRADKPIPKTLLLANL